MNAAELYIQAMKLDPVEAMNYLQSETCAVSDLAVTLGDVAEEDHSAALMRLREFARERNRPKRTR